MNLRHEVGAVVLLLAWVLHHGSGKLLAETSATLRAVEFVALTSEVVTELGKRLGLREGQGVTRQELGAAAKRVREFDGTLTFRVTSIGPTGRDVVLRISGAGIGRSGPLFQPPELIHRVEGEYQERTPSREGTVTFDATLDERGQIKELRFVSGPEILVEAATRAAFQWLFEPALVEDVPVVSHYTVRIPFYSVPPRPMLRPKDK